MYKKFMPALLFLIIQFCLSAVAWGLDEVIVNVTVSNFKNNIGMCRLLVFENKKGFPDNPQFAIKISNLPIINSSANITLSMPPGKYSFTVLHDENHNQKLDKTWYGKPTEGFGVSNNPKTKIGPPDFEDTIVDIKDKKNEIKIEIYNFGK